MADITTSTVDESTATTESTSTNTIPSNAERIQKINDMYDANLNSSKSNLEASYQQNLSNAQADKAKIGENYTSEKNNLASTYERQRRNNNLQASSRGLNTGAGSQMALAQQANYQSNVANLSKAQATAEGEADRNISDLTVQYQSAVNSAVAQNDYQRAAALLDEYNNQKADMQTQAETLAQYGDFSGYGQLGYSTDQVNNMTFAWLASNNASNGDLAYLSGALDRAYKAGTITAEQYKNIHGSYPPDSPEAKAAASSGSGWVNAGWGNVLANSGWDDGWTPTGGGNFVGTGANAGYAVSGGTGVPYKI